MKNIITAITIFVFAMSFTSCSLDDDASPSGGDDVRDAWVGQWTCVDSKKDGKQTYTVIIEKDPINSDQIFFRNFGNLGLNPPGESKPFGIISNDVVTIPSQQACGDDSWIVEGVGILTDKDHIHWDSYILNNIELTAMFTKN